MFLYMVTLYLRIGSMTFPQMVIGRAEVKNHMGRRALLTKTEREAIEDPDNAKYPYVAVSRVRKKIQEELPTDVQILARHHEELHQELIEVVCGDLTPTVRTDVEAKEKYTEISLNRLSPPTSKQQLKHYSAISISRVGVEVRRPCEHCSGVLSILTRTSERTSFES